MNQKITSLNNIKIKNYLKLKQKKHREASKMFIVEGYHLVEEAKKAKIIIEVLSADPNYSGTMVSPQIIKKLSSTLSPQLVIAICINKKQPILGSKLLVLANLQDPGNVGTLIRSAKAFNFDGVIIQGVDITNPKVIRSSQGAIFSIPVKQITNLTTFLQTLKIPLIGAVVNKNATKIKDFKLTYGALILGNEGKGLSKEILKILTHHVYIPINYESLNVASAGTILMYEINNNCL